MELDSDSELDNNKIIKLTQSNVNLNYQPSECVRPFQLPKQFPSTLSEFRSTSIGSEKSISTTPKTTMKSISVSPLTKKVTLLPTKETAESFQKYKVKSPSAGLASKNFCQVKIIPSQGGKLKAQLPQTPNISHKIEKPSTVTSLATEKKNRPIIKTITRLVDPNSKEIIGVREEITPSPVATVPNLKSIKYRNILPKTSDDLQSPKSMSAHNLDNQMQKVLIFKTNEKSTQPKEVLKKFGNKLVLVKNDSPSPKYLAEDIDKNSEKIYLKKSVNVSKGLKRTIIPSQNFVSNKKLNLDSSIKTLKSGDKCVILSSDEDENNQSLPIKYKIHVPKGNIVIKKISKETSIPINHDNFSENESTLFEKDSHFLDNHNISDSQFTHSNHEVGNSLNQSESIENNDDHLISSSDNKIYILKKALLSVEDEKLREEALKALNECGIKVKKRIPINQNSPRKLINESATQTDVFSLFKGGEFIKVDINNEGLTKINFKLLSELLDSQTLDTVKAKNLTNNEYPAKFSEEELNKMCDDFNSKNFQEVNKALEEKCLPSPKLLLKQLNMEFERAKNFDENGFLGIHKAVVNDDFNQVQKNLIILKACKLNVDVESQDYKTSLELAIEYEVNPQIVKILLEAGAQPVSSKTRHDSALILAARKSSKILSLLLKNIDRSNRSLLNAKDSEGLAAIHYCAQHGNLEGVTELLSLGVDVNLQDDKSGRTALFYAIESRNYDIPQDTYNEIAHKLLEKGAISNIPIFSKHTALSMIDEVKSHLLKIALNRAVR